MKYIHCAPRQRVSSSTYRRRKREQGVRDRGGEQGKRCGRRETKSPVAVESRFDGGKNPRKGKHEVYMCELAYGESKAQRTETKKQRSRGHDKLVGIVWFGILMMMNMRRPLQRPFMGLEQEE